MRNFLIKLFLPLIDKKINALIQQYNDMYDKLECVNRRYLELDQVEKALFRYWAAVDAGDGVEAAREILKFRYTYNFDGGRKYKCWRKFRWNESAINHRIAYEKYIKENPTETIVDDV